MLIHKSVLEPIYEDPVYDTRINGYDKGLINAWNVGRRLAKNNEDLVTRAKNGELPILGFKGGIKNTPKIKLKYGCLWYLAELQGIKGIDLNIDLEKEVALICSRTNIKVIFTSDSSKYSVPDDNPQE